MKTYRISNDISGASLGTWTAESREHALVAMLRDVGLRAEVIDGAVALDPRDVDADGVHLAGRVEDYTITEIPYAGASITVEVGRDTIDPQGVGSDEDAEACAEHILDAVREAFPGADVRAVGNGGRTSATTRDGEDFTREVREIVTQAFDTFDWSAEHGGVA